MGKKVWDHFWKDSKISKFKWGFLIRDHKKLLKEVNLPKNPKSLELGCGTGMISILMNKEYNSSLTLVDYSSESLKIVKKLLKNEKIKAKLIQKDILNLMLKEKYDLVHSQGLIEHFKGKTQNKIISKHAEFLKKDGRIIMFIPRPSLIYKLWRKTTELMTGKWPFGYEKPLKIKEAVKLIQKNNIKVLKINKTLFQAGYLCRLK